MGLVPGVAENVNEIELEGVVPPFCTCSFTSWHYMIHSHVISYM
jgi:hypothetical protein